MKLIVGLGNPGEKYASTRHNAGYMFIDFFANSRGFPDFSEKWNGLFTEKGSGDEKLILLKPMSFMNLSGEAVTKYMNFYKIVPSDVLIVFDDVDLPLGTIRFKSSGGPGTHNGMKSVLAKIGTENVPRLRIGIESRGLSAPEEMELDAFVLSGFSNEELSVFRSSLEDAVSEVEKSLA